MLKVYWIDGLTNIAFFFSMLLYRYINDYERIDSFLILPNIKGIKQFLKGYLIGSIIICLYIIVNIDFNNAQIYFGPQTPSNFISAFFILGFSFFAVALFEESLFRGYIMQKLLKKYSPFISALINSLIFGILHYCRYSKNTYFFLIGIINTILAGLIFSYVVQNTKSLMWAIGCHMSWDFTGALIFTNPYSILNLKLNTNILCGNNIIPESGLILTFIISLVFIIHFILKQSIHAQI